MAPMRRSKIAPTRPSRDPKWYCAAELFRWPAAAPTSRNETASIPRSPNSRSAATIIASRARAVRGSILVSATRFKTFTLKLTRVVVKALATLGG